MLSLIICSLLVVLSIVVLVFTILDKTEYLKSILFLNYLVVSLNLILSILSFSFCFSVDAVVFLIICISVLFLISASTAGLKGAFLQLTRIKTYKIYKIIGMVCSAIQVILIVVFCSQF